MSITVICKIFVKNFHLMQSDENFLREFFLLVIICTVNIWCKFDMNENIATQKFLAQKFCEQN